jgi:hydroxymethylpyrimidine pyrophosphatase-like HAD family hydrolase
MFENAHYSFAMENATEKVKGLARFVCESNDCEGVAKQIIKYVLS